MQENEWNCRIEEKNLKGQAIHFIKQVISYREISVQIGH